MKASIFQFALLLLCLGTLGCSESVEVLCEDAAQRQCERCNTCADDLEGDELNADEICGVTRSNCEAQLQEQCEYQSSTLEDPKSRLDDCIQSLDRLTCDSVLSGFAQGSRITTYECEYFL